MSLIWAFIMKMIKIIGLAACYAVLNATVQAAPTLISAMGTSATTYSLFAINTKKLPFGTSPTQVQNLLQAQLDLATPKLTGCWVTGDLNRSPVNCGNGAMQFGSTDFYTYNLGTTLAPFPLDKTLKPLILEALGANFITAIPGTIGDPYGRVVNIHFKQRVAQFGMLVDAGQVGAQSINGLQFIVNRQTTPVKPLTAGAPNFVGVEDSAGFTDLTIIASGSTRAWVADQFSFVPLSAF
jgi:hypothetical protein